jgi:hypothetical protein
MLPQPRLEQEDEGEQDPERSKDAAHAPMLAESGAPRERMTVKRFAAERGLQR